MTPKNIYKIFLPPKISIFLKPQKYWKSKFWTPKNYPSLRMYENIRVPSWGKMHDTTINLAFLRALYQMSQINV